MRKTIGCLHAHHSNIPGIEQALGADYALVHYVDPGFIPWLNTAVRRPGQLREHIERQLGWVAGHPADLVLITCTNYVAAMDEANPASPVPVVAIDEPFILSLLEKEGPHRIVFTNPATVQGTMRRLRHFAAKRGATLEAEPLLIEKSFELFMQGKADEYHELVAGYLMALPEGGPIVVGQLSMTAAAQRAERERGVPIDHPLRPLKSFVDRLTC